MTFITFSTKPFQLQSNSLACLYLLLAVLDKITVKSYLCFSFCLTFISRAYTNVQNSYLDKNAIVFNAKITCKKQQIDDNECSK
jgi:hypothetical protein